MKFEKVIEQFKMRMKILKHHELNDEEKILYALWYAEEICETIMEEIGQTFVDFELINIQVPNQQDKEEKLSIINFEHLEVHSVNHLKGFIPIHAIFQQIIPQLKKQFVTILNQIDSKFRYLKSRTDPLFYKNNFMHRQEIIQQIKTKYENIAYKCLERVHDAILNFLEQEELLSVIFKNNLRVELGVYFARYQLEHDCARTTIYLQNYYNIAFELIQKNENLIYQMIIKRASGKTLLKLFEDQIMSQIEFIILENPITLQQNLEIQKIEIFLKQFSNQLRVFYQFITQDIEPNCFPSNQLKNDRRKFQKLFIEYKLIQKIEEEINYLKNIDYQCDQVYSQFQLQSLSEIDIKCKYLLAKREFQLLKLKQNHQQIKQDSDIKLNMTVSNPKLLYFILREVLKRDYQKELVFVTESCKIGLSSILFSEAADQYCYKLTYQKEVFEQIWNNKQKLELLLKNFKQQAATHLQILIDNINIFDVRKGSVQIYFQIFDKLYQQDLNSFNIEKVQFFGPMQNLVGISDNDFDYKFDMQWFIKDYNQELRGSRDHRFVYYFPIGYYGFGLNVKKIYGDNLDWIKSDGKKPEWRTLYFVKQLNEQKKFEFQNDICKFSNEIIGEGVLFSDQITVCENLIRPIKVGGKGFFLVFQVRVNPVSIRQSETMALQNLFLINMSKDMRLYRVLIKEII